MHDKDIQVCPECGQDLELVHALQRLSLELLACVERFNAENSVSLHSLKFEDSEISEVKWHDPSPPIPDTHLMEN